jgi:isopentenyl-diphosphate delta-isomerase
MEDYIVLVDSDDNSLGFIDKNTAHDGEGVLHRAFSIIIVNDEGEMLIQKRSGLKRLWPLYWTNACCSHPRKGENIDVAVHRRLMEELGFDTGLKHVFSFKYHARFKFNGSENEFDHVFLGTYNGEVKPNPEEVSEWKWISVNELLVDLKKNPDKYTPWFKIILQKVVGLL